MIVLPSAVWNSTACSEGGRSVMPAELEDEVHVPRLAAELAVGRGPQADALLHADDIRDGGVLDRAELGRRDQPGGVLLSRPVHLGGSQQAADVVGPERRRGTSHSPSFTL